MTSRGIQREVEVKWGQTMGFLPPRTEEEASFISQSTRNTTSSGDTFRLKALPKLKAMEAIAISDVLGHLEVWAMAPPAFQFNRQGLSALRSTGFQLEGKSLERPDSSMLVVL